MRGRRKFEVFQEVHLSVTHHGVGMGVNSGPWRWRCRSGHNGKIVFTSGESFHDRSGAIRAARREANLMKLGVAVVEVV